MIKRTLYFGNPAYLSKKEDQLIVKYPEEKLSAEGAEIRKTERKDHEQEQDDGNIDIIKIDKNDKYKSRTNQNIIPIEDIGIMILDHQQITVTQGLIASLLENNSALITCDKSHLPTGLFLPLTANQVQSERFQAQIEASQPLKKQLWQQTISAKIMNQALLLKQRGIAYKNMEIWSAKVKSGDAENLEGRAAAYYWKNLFPQELEFTRDRYGLPPNNLLNYGYAILRAIIARGLVSSGLLPTLGIHHHNKYNAYCLADDIMEPFRPYVDKIVCEIIENGEDFEELNTSIKKQFLELPVTEIIIEGERSPLMVGVQRTTTSLVKCYQGEQRKICYPVFS